MARTKEIRVKIESIRGTQKITGAMEKVAASKMRRAEDRMRLGMPYAENIHRLIGHLARAQTEYRHDFLNERAVKTVAFLVVSTDRGLCGGLNINLFKEVVRAMDSWTQQGVEVRACLLGSKAVAFFRNLGERILSATTRLGDHPGVQGLIGHIRIVLDAYKAAEVDRIYLASNHFHNTMTQVPKVQQLLPLPKTDDAAVQETHWDYIYEPDARDIMAPLMDRYIESLVYQAVVENVACEQASKMVAMKNATENAADLIDDLQLLYNNVRQAAITQELAEIVGGAAAT